METRKPKSKYGILKRLVMPTPVRWKNVAKTSGSLTATCITAYGAVVSFPTLIMPVWFSMYIGWVIFIGTAITTYALQHVVTPPTK